MSQHMLRVASMAKACSLSFNEKYLTSAIRFEAERGYRNALGQTMRFSTFLHSSLLKLCSHSNHKSARRLLDEVDFYAAASVSDRSNILNKVSVLMGYSSVQDLIEHEKDRRESDEDLKGSEDDFDISFACRRFPSIILGCSPFVELYNNDAFQPDTVELLPDGKCGEFLPSSIGGHLIQPDKLGEKWLQFDDPEPTFSVLDARNSSNLPSLSKPTLAGDQEITYVIHAEGHERQSNLIHADEAEGKTDVIDVEDSVTEFSESVCDCKPQIETASELIFDKPISCIPGISTRHYRLLEKIGLHTVRKLLQLFPRTYADLRNAHGVIDDGRYFMFVGKVLSSRGIKAGYSFSFLEVVVGCDIASEEGTDEIEGDDFHSGGKKPIYLHLKKYFRGARFTSTPFLKSIASKHKEGDIVYVSGQVKEMKQKDHYEMREYTIDMLEAEEESHAHGDGRPYPLYPAKGGLNPCFLRDIISRALQALAMDIDPIPQFIREEFGLLSLRDAYFGIHCPKHLREADLARKRLVFDEFFYLQLGRFFQMLEGLGTQIEKDGLLERYQTHEPSAISVDSWSNLTRKLLMAFPYPLTSSQLNAVSEIIWDLKRPLPMNRLLQGDVGSGKTVVAFLACMEVIASGFQAALMVPTELLAVQHYEHFLGLIKKMEEEQPSIALLTGSTPAKQARMIRKGLQTGEIALVIGTHSLIADSVEFAALRIAVVDEQHRFGVIQRGKFSSKLYYAPSNFSTSGSSWNQSSGEKVHMAPHILAISATPIPRTLALALYGDMSLTQITDLPPGRLPIETFVLEGNDSGLENVYQMMQDELLGGGKVYLVYPVIDESEQLPQLHAAAADLESISSRFKGYQCGLLHGRMKSDEKGEALKRFQSGETKILLSTQVIEIGVDVPDASMMVVMNAERFGIAQLHQLRGRVGRGTRKSKCVFLPSSSGALNRLKVLEKSSDGFYLANIDLMIRGPGNLLGKKQSGHLPEFPIARLEIDGDILQEAHLAALKVLSTSHDLKSFPKLKAELSMRQPLCLLGD